MAAIDTVRNLMHGERRMCSVCEIARETGMDTEVVKVLMVDIANETVWHPVAAPPRKNRLYSDADEQTIRELYNQDLSIREIAQRMHRNHGSVAHQIYIMQHNGTLQKRNKTRGETK